MSKRATARELWMQWDARRYRVEDLGHDNDHNLAVLQEAKDRLVDFIEANDLVGSEWDPRGLEPNWEGQC